MRRLAIVSLMLLISILPCVADEIGFIEDFALAKDRAESLKQLIPGTEDYYYFHCLHYLNTEQFSKIEPMTRLWLERHGETQRLHEIQTRYALLTYTLNQQRTLDYLRHRLGLSFNHERSLISDVPNLPTSLNPQLIARETLKANSFQRWRFIENFEPSSFDWLAKENLNWERRRQLLQQAQLPDLPNLPQMIAADMQAEHAVPFGQYAIHRKLTLAQHEELLRLRPDLLNQTVFVQNILLRLQPNADENWRYEPELLKAYLDRMLTFVRRLAPVHNNLKAHVLYHRLLLDRSLGNYDRSLFLEYLQLPRQQHYMSKSMLESLQARQYPVDLNANFTEFTKLAPVGFDEPLVRDYLKHFLVNASSPQEFTPYINDVYLRHLFAETKIENGLGDAEQWASQLPPEVFRSLKERVDIDFDSTNKTHFKANEPVQLHLLVKNVPTLIIKIYEINTSNYYREHKQEVDTDINLDGLIPNAERTEKFAEPPLRRMPRQFTFPELSKPGVYVIDFIGSGKSSRALIRKGSLRPLVSLTPAGHVVQVINDARQLVTDASLWIGGQEYHAEKDGSILVPFSTNPSRQPIVIQQGDFACLEYLNHQAENYQLAAGFYVDRESLLSQRMAQLILRPGLMLNQIPISLKLLEEARLVLTAIDQDGIATTSEIRDFKLFEDRETTHEFRVPPRLAHLTVALHAKVKSLSQDKKIDLSAQETFSLNEIDKSNKIEDMHLAQYGTTYVLELRGKTGEERVDRIVYFSIKHRDFREPIDVTLKSDDKGRILLGELNDIDYIKVTNADAVSHTWSLPKNQFTYRQIVHAGVGETIQLPYLGRAQEITRSEFAFFELRGAVYYADRLAALAINKGALEISGLTPGDYQLTLKQDNQTVWIRVVAGENSAGHWLGHARFARQTGLKPPRISNMSANEEELVITLRETSPFTRVHLLASRYKPAFSAFANLSKVRDAELDTFRPSMALSMYLTGRDIGDEYRYVLDRKLQTTYPGNMLDRPSLLLNPWAVRSTETTEQSVTGGTDFEPKGPGKPQAPLAPRTSTRPTGPILAGDFANLDFLADSSAVLLNLIPEKDGTIKIKRKDLGNHSTIQAVVVDPLHTLTRTIVLPETSIKIIDQRMKQGLDPKAHFTQQKQISVLGPKQTLVIADVLSSRFEVYDSLPKVYGLYNTLSHNTTLVEFNFILGWPKLKTEEKHSLYSKYACHELNFFIYKKDPPFFQNVVKPYLANKKHKTFMDMWLLEMDLNEFLQPWAFDRLNTVERVLLAQRIVGEMTKTERYMNDLYRLQPPNLERFQVLFNTAVQGSLLDVETRLGMPVHTPKPELMEELRKNKRDEQSNKVQMNAPTAPTSGIAGGAGGLGGGGRGSGLKDMKEKGKEEVDSLKKGDASKTRSGATVPEDKALKEAPQQDAYFYSNERARRQLQQLYRRLDATQEWAENHYYQVPLAMQIADLIKVNPFWLDFVKHDGRNPFLSRHLAEVAGSFSEMMLALSVLDVPFEPGKHEVKYEGQRMTFTAASPVVAFHEEVRPTQAGQAPTTILVSQNFYRHGDRYRVENGEQLDKFITDEFVIQTVYGCQVVVTNPSPTRQKLAVLWQLPIGALPVEQSQYTRTVLLDLEPYHTKTIDYLFYFPFAGTFQHYPVHVAKNEVLMAFTQPFTFKVVTKPSKLDTTSWDYVSQFGSNEDVLAMLTRENLNTIQLDKMAFRMRDRAFFETVVKYLDSRHVYNPTLWSYSIYHNAPSLIQQFLSMNDTIIQECSGPIQSPLLQLDLEKRHLYEHLEYKPLVNARAHALGARRQIVNKRFHEQYESFLKLLSYKSTLQDQHRLAVCYYLLLQDRIAEAFEEFAKIDPNQLTTRIQYDYFAAYMDMYHDLPTKARAIATNYLKHPVDRWRNAFAAIVSQLDEIEGKAGKVTNPEDRDQQQTHLASKEPSFDFAIDAKTIQMTWQNLESVRINYYLMDVELLFSRNPFTQQATGQFISIKPNETQIVQLPGGKQKLDVPLPTHLTQRNVMVEIQAAGKTRSLPYVSNAMNVVMNENYGQLRVMTTTNNQSLPKVYVKVYARYADGEVKFYKDGYTDLRGRFDYASVSTPELKPIQRFALLILSEKHGAQIREVAPPQR